MSGFWTLFGVEVRRALARRLVRVLVAVAVLACAVAGVVVFVTTSAADVAAADHHVARLVDLWSNGEDSLLGVTVAFLAIGALIGGASVVGAEWRAGTVVTMATWAPRRGRVLLARFAACAVLAAVISVALQMLLVLAVLPTMLSKGSTSGIDGAWVGDLAFAVGRSMAICALAALVGATVASIGRNTTATLAVAFVELAVVESIVRGVWPERARWLVGENLATFLPWRPMENVSFERGPGLAAVTLLLYAIVLTVVATVLFRRRDIAATT